jgi:hypothetical protein
MGRAGQPILLQIRCESLGITPLKVFYCYNIET